MYSIDTNFAQKFGIAPNFTADDAADGMTSRRLVIALVARSMTVPFTSQFINFTKSGINWSTRKPVRVRLSSDAMDKASQRSVRHICDEEMVGNREPKLALLQFLLSAEANVSELIIVGLITMLGITPNLT